MNNRFTTLIIAAVACLASLAPSQAADEAPRPRRPNIVFILADDLGWAELGSYGQRKIRTPNLDKLAAEGMRFTQHYSGAPVCAPARCVLMTGKHLGHAQIRSNQQAKAAFPEFNEGQHPITADALTIASVLRKAGYRTGAMGKWGLGPVGSTGDPNRHGFDLFFGYNCQSVAHSYYPRYLWRNAEQIEINPQPISGHPKPATGEVKMETYLGKTYAPDAMLAEALSFLDAQAPQRADAAASTPPNPFFLYLPFVEPHLAMHPPKDRVEAYPADWDPQVYRGEAGYTPHPRPRAAYAAMISNLDRCVGEVLKKLDALGLRDDTLIVFTSDNGATHKQTKSKSPFGVGGVDTDFFRSTADLRGYKGSVYEGGIRVPMIVRFPGRVAAGTENDFPCYFADWFPTLCDVAGLEHPQGLDGESLLRTLTTTNSAPFPKQRSKPMLWVFPGYEGQVAVRIGDMKIVRQRLKTKQPGEWELYDLARDRSETKNIAAEHPELVAQAVAILKSEVDENKTFPLTIPGVND
jgi:arylsulfatase A